MLPIRLGPPPLQGQNRTIGWDILPNWDIDPNLEKSTLYNLADANDFQTIQDLLATIAHYTPQELDNL